MSSEDKKVIVPYNTVPNRIQLIKFVADLDLFDEDGDPGYQNYAGPGGSGPDPDPQHCRQGSNNAPIIIGIDWET